MTTRFNIGENQSCVFLVSLNSEKIEFG